MFYIDAVIKLSLWHTLHAPNELDLVLLRGRQSREEACRRRKGANEDTYEEIDGVHI